MRLAGLAALAVGWAACSEAKQAQRPRDFSVAIDLSQALTDGGGDDQAMGDLALSPDLRAPVPDGPGGTMPDLSAAPPDLRPALICDDLGCAVPLAPMGGDPFFPGF